MFDLIVNKIAWKWLRSEVDWNLPAKSAGSSDVLFFCLVLVFFPFWFLQRRMVSQANREDEAEERNMFPCFSHMVLHADA